LFVLSIPQKIQEEPEKKIINAKAQNKPKTKCKQYKI